MVEVVFSDSEKGAMRYAQRFPNKGGSAVAIGILRSGGEQPTQEEYDAALAASSRGMNGILRIGKVSRKI